MRAIRFLVDRADLSGAFNVTAPNPVPFRVVAKTLGRVLRRPVFLPAPDFALRLLLGAERAGGLILQGQRVVPARLTEAGFAFRFTDLEPALRNVLGK